MKNNRIIILLFLLFSGCALTAQPDSIRFLCKDIVKARGNNRYTGTITQMDSAGYLKITTWSGMKLTLPTSIIINIDQQCVTRTEQGYGWKKERPPFRETGWYNYTRMATATGQSGRGILLQHSIGYRFSHLLHTGIGTGIENFSLGEEPVTYPVYAECRTFLMPGRISPFLSAGVGWSFMGKPEINGWDGTTGWKGGLTGEIQAGYRFGNHFIAYTGFRMQRQERTWEQLWSNIRGVDRIVKRRIVIGIGVYL